MKRTLSLILVLAMAFSLMLGVIPSAEEAAGELEISEARVEFGDVVYLFIAVDYTAADAGGITLQITNNKTGAQTILEPDASIEVREGRVAFKYTDLGAKNIGDELTLQALKNGVASGDSVNYSVLEYAIKAQGLGNANLTNLVNAMLAYGAAAQEAYEHEGSYDLTKNYGLVVVNGSAEGKAIAEVGSTATFTPDVAGSTLYDMTLTAIDAVTVPAGTSRFFYINASQKTHVNLDMTGAVEDVGTAISTGTVNVRSSKTVDGKYFNPAGFNAGNSGQFQFGVANSSFSLTAVTGANGYLKYAAGATAGTFKFNEVNGDKHLREQYTTDVFTFAITIGKEGTTNIPEAVFTFGGKNSLGIFDVKNRGNSTVFCATIGTSLERDEDGNEIVLCSIDGEEGVNKFVTIFVVADMNTGSFTIYNSQNSKVHTNTGTSNIGTASQGYVSGNRDRATDLKSIFTTGGSDGNLFLFQKTNATNLTLLLQKCKLFADNIFE